MNKDWSILPFTEVVDDKTGGNIKTLQKDYLPVGAYPIVDQGKELIGGYTNNEASLCKADLPAIVFGDHTKCLKYIDFPFCVGADGTKVLLPKIRVDTRYLFHFLHSIRFPDAGYSRHFKFLKKSQIMLPPIEDQKRIATILDQADAVWKLRLRAIEKIATIGQAIFHQVISDFDGTEFENLGNLTSKIGSGATPKGGGASYQQTGIPLVRSMNVRDGYFDQTGLVFLNEAQAKKLDNVTIQSNDVFLNITGASVARTCLAPDRVSMGRVNQHVSIIRTTDRLIPEFLEAFLLYPPTKQKLLKIADVGATRQAITKSQLQDLLVPVPPLSMQMTFAFRRQQLATMRDQLHDNCLRLKKLYMSAQQRAFRGEL